MYLREYQVVILLACRIFFLGIVGGSDAISKTLANTEESIKVYDSTVDKIIQQVAEHSNYKIYLIGKPEMRKISGVFSLSEVETTFRRLFKGVNTFVEFDEGKKEIYIKFPAPGPVRFYTSKTNYLPSTDKVDPDSGMTHAEILTMREYEKEVRMTRVNTPGEVDPENGLGYIEQMDVRRSESQEIQEKAIDPKEIDLTTNTSYLEQLERKEQEEIEILAKANDASQVDPSTGDSYMQQIEMREREKRERMARVSDPSAVDPESGMTYRELLQRRQEEQKML